MKRPQSIDAIMEAELSKKEETVQAPKLQPTPKHVADDDEEATIIANPQPKKDEKDAKPKPEPQPVVNPKSTQSTYTFTSLENNDNVGSGKGLIIGMIVAIIFVVIILVNYGGCGNKVEEANVQSVENTEPQKVERMGWSSPLGACQYSGPVDNQALPHGYGEVFFNDGRYYKGDIEHGVFTGEDCYFKYGNGDEYRGKFRNNSFYYGTYTIASDKSYFTGSYKDGQPQSGTWYNQDGSIIRTYNRL
jgi:hypothetical protein